LAYGQPIAFWGAALSAQTGENMKAMLRKLWLEDEGQDLAEYGLLLILIAVAVVTGITLFKDQIVAAFSSATSVLSGS
jgi:Flp pilus assembly pilin Flp